MSIKQALTFSTRHLPRVTLQTGYEMKALVDERPIYFDTQVLALLKDPEANPEHAETIKMLQQHIDSMSKMPFITLQLPNDLFLSHEPAMRPRSEVETDTDSLHYIPYIVVADKKTGEILSYSRGKAGDESRLHDLRSIGWGGHVDTFPKGVTKIQTRQDLVATLIETVRNELLEEIGYKLTDKDIANLTGQLAITPANETLEERLAKNYPIRMGLYDPSNAVGQVHLGVVFYLAIDREKTKLVFEEGTVLDPKWEHPVDIMAAIRREEIKLENWSTGVLATIYPMEFLHHLQCSVVRK